MQAMLQGVTKHRRSGRWEAHVWVREDGKQAYLGGYSTEEEAAEAHDVAALKCHGLKAKTNFHISR
jgi:AP2-like factor (euAP2 lineage)